MSTLIAYYSHTGNNRFLAEELARRLDADLEEIVPRVPRGLVLTLALFRLPLRLRPMKHQPEDYDRVVLVGPIWTGAFIAPLKAFVKKYRSRLKSMYFATCCGSKDEDRDGGFGYRQVFHKVQAAAGEKLKGCAAFPIHLVLSEEEQRNDEAIMAARLTEDTCKGVIDERIAAFADGIKSRTKAPLQVS